MDKDEILSTTKKEAKREKELATDDSEKRTQFTQRTPKEILEDVEGVQEDYGLPSRNATINFMLKQAAKDL